MPFVDISSFLIEGITFFFHSSEKYHIGEYLQDHDEPITIILIHGVPQERRRTVNPLRGKTEFLANEKFKVNPNRGKQGGIPEKESPGIANNKSNPNGRQKELVPRCPQGNSNNNPSGSNSAVPAKAKDNPRREYPFKFYAQVRSEWAPKGNKFLSACRNSYLRRNPTVHKEFL